MSWALTEEQISKQQTEMRDTALRSMWAKNEAKLRGQQAGHCPQKAVTCVRHHVRACMQRMGINSRNFLHLILCESTGTMTYIPMPNVSANTRLSVYRMLCCLCRHILRASNHRND